MSAFLRMAPLALALVLPSCFFSDDDDAPPVVVEPTGVLVVDWSISGLQDPAACRQSDAEVVSIAVETADGVSLGEFEDACEAFDTSIELEPGDYFADAVLLDSTGAARTTPVGLGLVRIFGDDELVVPVDFPSDSFY
ncbi:MAG TPA: hypothetical protein VMS65_05825 [Polyangiaceae bacterium]|nr:hypothetical protein [Polyangiaceae bacterium]